MIREKRFKDPIYGYIDVKEEIISQIVDTPNFQRLRNIIQTSYSPLYSSAVHNRFVHSLGVYHLGRLVAETVRNSIKDLKEVLETRAERYIYIFEVACLLHDVGHAPFSHTGEEYFLNNGNRDLLHKEILELVDDKNLEREIKDENYTAAAHELMSVIVALKQYNDFFKDEEEKSFFTRCITGYYYEVEQDMWHSFLNCLISLLNSAVIDVDKLDYLIRDAYITGFDTIAIDYERLLKNMKIREVSGKVEVVYTKGAISVIENVVYAHDAERKWIQNHPIVQYESYLLKNATRQLMEQYKTLFSYECLTIDGAEINHGYRVRLLSDADILFLMKNLPMDGFVSEYFCRKERRHPLWKSESEYKALFENKIFRIVEKGLDELCKYINTVNKSQKINEEALQACERDIEHVRELIGDSINPNLEKNILIKKRYKKWLDILKQFAKEEDIPFDFIIIKADQFNSGFAKESFGGLKIEFPELNNPCYFKDVTSALTAPKSDGDKFYYLFYQRTSEKKDVSGKRLGTLLGTTAIQEDMDSR